MALKSLHFMNVTNTQLHMKQFTLKKIRKLEKQNLCNKGQKPLRQAGEADHVDKKNPIPGTLIYNWEISNIYIFPEEKLTFRSCMRGVPKMLGFENLRHFYLGKTQTIGHKELVLKGLAMQTHSKSSTTIPIWKVPRPYVNKNHLLILKCLPEKQETAGTFFRNTDTGMSHISDLTVPCQCLC